MLRNLYMRLRARLDKRYLIEIVDEKTLSRSRELALRPLTVLLYGALVFLVIVGTTAAIFIYSPALHRLIPGYINPEEFRQEREALSQQLEEMESQIAKWSTYSESLQRLAGMGGGNGLVFDSTKVPALSQKVALPVEVAPASPGTSSEATNMAYGTDGQGQIKVVYVPDPRIKAIKSDRPTLLKRLFVPLEGNIRNPYNEAKGHYGVDIVAAENTMIHAATAGFVILSEYSNENGWVIAVAGQQGITTFYKHNSRLLKKAGTYVQAGEPIAVIGNSGENSTGMHLHFEIWQEGRPLDPARFIQFN